MSSLRILWFVNAPFPEMVRKAGLAKPAGGTWLFDLGRELTQNADIEFGVATVSEVPDSLIKFEEEGTSYYVVPHGRVARDLRRYGLLGWNGLLETLSDIVQDFKPDAVVVHGTEFIYGMLTPMIDVPVVISLQGIIDAFYPHYWGDLSSIAARLRYPRAIVEGIRMRRQGAVERRIFEANRFFSGRTFWDRSQVFRLQPNAQYFFEPHVLRPEFYQSSWNLAHIDRHTIYTTTTPELRKGTVCLLEALDLVRRAVPDARLVIGGPIGNRGVAAFLRRRLRELGLEEVVDFLGYVDGTAIQKNLLKSHVYVIPSYIENSPQNLAEAQAMGTPSIASNVGGNPTMVTDGQDGLLFNSGDPAVLAMSILRVFADDDLAVSLSENASRMARKRHDPKAIAASHVHMCREIVRATREEDSASNLSPEIARRWYAQMSRNGAK